MSNIRHYWNLHFLGFEKAVSLIVSFIFLIWVYRSGGSLVDNILKGNRSAIYGALASIFGSLLGFVITAVSIIIGYSASDKLEFLRKSRHYPTLWYVMISTIKALSLATVVMMIGLIFDRDSSPNHVFLCLSVFAILFSFFRLARCIWVLDNIIHIIIKKY